MRTKITLTALGLILLLTIPAFSCECDPECEGCAVCENGVCVVGDCDNPCEYCVMESGTWGDCKCYEDCCEDSDCGSPICWDCVYCQCVCNEECCEDSDCTGECHNGCGADCKCIDDDSKCIGCESCIDGSCEDDTSNCSDYCYDCENNDCVSKWTASPAISGASIKKQYDIQWFHISQSCTLKAKGHDYDSCRGIQQETDYIDLDSTQWSGQYLLTTSGAQVLWNPDKDEPTGESGVTITATIKDDATNPDGSNTDDGDAQATKQMYAFEATAEMEYYYTAGSGSVAIYETDGTEGYSSWLPLDSDGVKRAENDGDIKQSDKYGSAIWAFGTNPTAATPGNGTFQATIGAETQGGYSAQVLGNKRNPNYSSASVTFGVCSINVITVTASSDSPVASVGIGFLFESLVFGNHETSKIELCTADDGGEYRGPIYYNSAREKTWYVLSNHYSSQNATAYAQVRGEAKCFEYYSSSTYSQFFAGGQGVKYKVADPTFVGDLSHTPPEEGYND